MLLHIGSDAATVQHEAERELLEQTASKMLEVLPRVFKQLMIEGKDKMPAELTEVGQTQIGLFHLLAHNDCTITELARRQKVTAPTISRMIDSLVSRNLVERRQDPSDRRITWISLTPRGRAVNEEIAAAFRAAMTKFMGPLDDRQLCAITEALDSLEGLIKRNDEAHNR